MTVETKTSIENQMFWSVFIVLGLLMVNYTGWHFFHTVCVEWAACLLSAPLHIMERGLGLWPTICFLRLKRTSWSFINTIDVQHSTAFVFLWTEKGLSSIERSNM